MSRTYDSKQLSGVCSLSSGSKLVGGGGHTSVIPLVISSQNTNMFMVTLILYFFLLLSCSLFTYIFVFQHLLQIDVLLLYIWVYILSETTKCPTNLNME